MAPYLQYQGRQGPVVTQWLTAVWHWAGCTMIGPPLTWRQQVGGTTWLGAAHWLVQPRSLPVEGNMWQKLLVIYMKNNWRGLYITRFVFKILMFPIWKKTCVLYDHDVLNFGYWTCNKASKFNVDIQLAKDRWCFVFTFSGLLIFGFWIFPCCAFYFHFKVLCHKLVIHI